GYLYTLVRNLHRSNLEADARRGHTPLETVDFDTAGISLRNTDAAHLLYVYSELRRICEFACERKESSKSGSILILRFFHDLMPGEIAAIARLNRANVDERLRLVRQEARSYLSRPEPMALSLASVGDWRSGQECLLSELLQRVWASKTGSCRNE